jgi:hypothetical protein
MEFLDKLIFSDITIFDLRDKENRHIVHICGTERQRADFDLHCDSPCFAPWVLPKFIDHYLLWAQWWLVSHNWTCYTPLPPGFCRIITMICHNSRSTRTALPYIQTWRWDHLSVMCFPSGTAKLYLVSTGLLVHPTPHPLTSMYRATARI